MSTHTSPLADELIAANLDSFWGSLNRGISIQHTDDRHTALAFTAVEHEDRSHAGH
ncbi:hypothetical protein ABZS66_11610 [Dactylosporangium sp. NPDC005572]|uniref:hypothetical protein n=1 Tax=Dactylosporangium sp. NPDC005572 TaxID=3156889 RepID=UPI0033AC8271